MSNPLFVSIDLGTEVCHISSGELGNGILKHQERYSFYNHILKIDGGYHWDFQRIYDEVLQGIRMVSGKIDALAVTAWGGDYGLLDEEGSIIGMPYSFRDARSVGMMDKVFKRVPASIMFNYTGVQPHPVNTLFQLFAHHLYKNDELKRAVKLLFLPDLVNYFLSGKVQTEFTIATTSQMLQRETQTWCMPLIDLVMLPQEILYERNLMKGKRAGHSRMAPLVEPCTRIGFLTPEAEMRSGHFNVPVISVGSHYIASSIAAIPAEGDDWAYMICGESTIIGVETTAPIITKTALEANFTNEGGVEGTNLFHQTVAGLGLLENCRKDWYSDSPITLDRLTEMYIEATPFDAFIDPDYYTFFSLASVSELVRSFCYKSGQNIPKTHAQIIRIIMESLAMNFRYLLDSLKRVTGKNVQRIHLTGKYSQIPIFCQFIANAIGIQVVSGPVDTISIGNLLCQARTLGFLNSLDDIRSVVLHSFETNVYQPDEDQHQWSKEYTRFLAFKN